MREGAAMGQDMPIRLAVISATVFCAIACHPALAGPGDMNDLIVVDHQPHPFGGFASDTLFLDMFDNPFSQRVADDFELTTAVSIGAINWWGFYDLDNPPAEETFRIRFYGARAGDGLPDESNVVFEQMVDTPARTATGRRVAVSVGPDEYLYETALSSAVSLSAQTPYWLEVVQIGDLNTAFRWEFSEADLNAQAGINPTSGDWVSSAPVTVDAAFQLVAIPEPASGLIAVLLGLGAAVYRKAP